MGSGDGGERGDGRSDPARREVPPDPEPPVMWPEAGSGFEADPFSPAGSLQREGMFLRGLSGGRAGRAALWTLLGVVAIVVVTLVATVVIHHL